MLSTTNAFRLGRSRRDARRPLRAAPASRRTSLVLAVFLGWALAGCATSGTPSDDGSPSTPTPRAETEPPPEVEELADLLERIVSVSEEAFEDEHKVSRIMVDRIGDGREATLNTTLTTPYSYRIAAVGSRPIRDLRLRLDSEDWTVAADSTPGDQAVVEHTPFGDEAVSIVTEARSVRSRASGQPNPFYFLLFSRRGGVQALDATARDAEDELLELVADLIVFSASMIEDGVRIRHIEVDRIELHEDRTMSYPLRAGVQYRLVGRGGPGAADLNLTLRDEQENPIESDHLPDNVPVLADVQVPSSGAYTIEVGLAALEVGADPRGEYWFYWLLGEQ